MSVFGTTSLRIIIQQTSVKKAYKTLHGELYLTQLSVNDIMAKIKTIRTRYCSELAKIRKSEKSGAGSNDLYVPRLFWFKQSPTFWKLVKRIEPLKGINTPAFIVHIHWGWIIFDAHPKWKSVNSPLTDWSLSCRRSAFCEV